MIRARCRLMSAAILLSLTVAAGSDFVQADENQGTADKRPAIRLKQSSDRDGRPRFEVTGLDAASRERLAQARLSREQWQAIFRVFVESESASKVAKPVAMLGSYRVADGLLIFEPCYPLEQGLRYRAEFSPAAVLNSPRTDQPISAVFAIPKEKPQPPAAVSHIYPTRDRLPENQLKFYIHFSAPMSRGGSYRYVRLLNATGKAVDLPFLELEQELWDDTGKRFTLYFDPGRVKRGLKPREEAGPILEEGKSYTLVIDRRWPDAKGNPLAVDYRKSFKVGPPDDEPPDPRRWQLKPPAAGTSAALVVRFPKPLDHGLLHRFLSVAGPAGRMVAGKILVTNEETGWHFTPERPWQAGNYRLVVDRTLEDLAGNTIGKPFEVDVFRQVTRQIKTENISLPFTIR